MQPYPSTLMLVSVVNTDIINLTGGQLREGIVCHEKVIPVPQHNIIIMLPTRATLPNHIHMQSLIILLLASRQLFLR